MSFEGARVEEVQVLCQFLKEGHLNAHFWTHYRDGGGHQENEKI